jgi:putative membrane-bound dehydrogenase-like protein
MNISRFGSRFACALATLALPTALFGASDAPPADVVPFAGLSPQEAAKAATLPSGFAMHVFAAEPELVQPIAFCLDHRGRVWVAEGITYPKRKGHPPKIERAADADPFKAAPEQLKDILGGADRILVFEDTDGDHQADKRTVFMENVNLISGLQVGMGGVWIGAAPYLLFVPVNDWDNPKPAGDPQILLDGWNYTADTHETLNTFTWGPDGWLYGCHGVFCPSHVGKPGTPAKDRQWMDAGVWRYHPSRHAFEVFTEGGSNPWGIDFDEHGQLWAEMCVIPHLWHMIHNARIERQGGEHFTVGPEETRRYAKATGKPVHPYIYDDIKQHGDHVHWAGNLGPHAANARSDSAGGGHAHAGVMCYLGESWPGEYRGQLFIGNIHGQRINMDIPERSGSGFVGKHGKDFVNFNDSWSQTLNQTYDQDGSVFVIDWYDKNQCHHTREDGHDRANGRIYKIVYNNQKTTRVDLAKLSDEELIKLVPSKNEFMSRHARQILQERAVLPMQTAAGSSDATVRTMGTALTTLLRDAKDTSAKLRALWALDVTTGVDANTIAANLKSKDEWVRAWAIQLGGKSLVRSNPEIEKTFRSLAKSDPSPLVRLFLASAVREFPPSSRGAIARTLLSHSEDASDHNLPLMYWYAMEPLCADNPKEMLSAAVDTKLPKLLTFTSRRVASIGTPAARDLVVAQLAGVKDSTRQLEILNGLAAAVKGERNIAMPKGWENVETKLGASKNAEMRTLVATLSLTFGSPNARVALRKTVEDKSAPVPSRLAALDSLVAVKDPELPSLLLALLEENDLRGPALRALAGFNEPNTPERVLAVYPSLSAREKRDALNTLVARPTFSKPLLAAVESGKISGKDLTADVVRQLRTLKDADIQAQVTKLYGAAREVSADKKAEMERYRNIYRAGGSQPGNASPGRVVFNKVCAQCHTLFDSGGKVGPDITGANRSDLNYLLENITDPNAVIPNEYRASEIETKDGRTLTGIVKIMGDKSIVLQTANELVTLSRDEIAKITQNNSSMMPEGLLAPLTDQEVRDLLYYLTRAGQVPLPVQSAAK